MLKPRISEIALKSHLRTISVLFAHLLMSVVLHQWTVCGIYHFIFETLAQDHADSYLPRVKDADVFLKRCQKLTLTGDPYSSRNTKSFGAAQSQSGDSSV